MCQALHKGNGQGLVLVIEDAEQGKAFLLLGGEDFGRTAIVEKLLKGNSQTFTQPLQGRQGRIGALEQQCIQGGIGDAGTFGQFVIGIISLLTKIDDSGQSVDLLCDSAYPLL